MSALIKDGAIREIIMQSGWKFYYPAAALEEIKKYQELIIEKSKLSKEEYEKLFSAISHYVVFIPLEKIKENIKEAEEVMNNIDPKDTIFIAAAFSTKNDGIWSDDMHFAKQNSFKALKTEEIIKFFKNMQNNIWKNLG